MGLKLSGALPDETTILNFRHLLEKHILGQGLFEEINAHLESQGLWLREGTIVGATIIEAPSSTKNRARERDPEMRQTRKGNKWHFGMKIHIGVDSDTGLAHSMSATAANVHDITEAHNLLHGGETMVWCDAGYQAVHQREENWELKVDWQVAMRPGKRRKLEPGSDEAVAEKEKASVRAKVEHPFLKVKRILDCGKVRYRGLAKNTQRLALLLGLCNLMTAEGPLAGLRGGRPAQTRHQGRFRPQRSRRRRNQRPLTLTNRARRRIISSNPGPLNPRPSGPGLVQRIPKDVGAAGVAGVPGHEGCLQDEGPVERNQKREDARRLRREGGRVVRGVHRGRDRWAAAQLLFPRKRLRPGCLSAQNPSACLGKSKHPPYWAR